MNKFKIITNSCSDLPKDLREKYDIDYVMMNIVNGENVLQASLDWDKYTPHEFYDWMRKGTKFTTQQVAMFQYVEKFTECLKQGYDILYISTSSALSGSINASLLVRSELLEKYPDAKIICIDPLRACLAQGMITIWAAMMRDEGMSIEDVAKKIEENKLKFNQIGTPESLEYLKRAGRVKASSAFFGDLFGVKPIIIADKIGQNYAYKKVKGRKTSLLEIVKLVKERIENPEQQTILLGHGDSPTEAEFVKNELLKETKCKEVLLLPIGPVIGASTGPGTIIAYFYGEEVTIQGE